MPLAPLKVKPLLGHALKQESTSTLLLIALLHIDTHAQAVEWISRLAAWNTTYKAFFAEQTLEHFDEHLANEQVSHINATHNTLTIHLIDTTTKIFELDNKGHLA